VVIEKFGSIDVFKEISATPPPGGAPMP
jgi:hypothetical protein